MACLGWAGTATAQQSPAHLKGYALQEYLQGQKWQSTPRPAPTAPPVYPQRSVIHAYTLPYPHPEPGERAYVTAHLPPGANLWVEGKLVVSEATGEEYELKTRPLAEGRAYPYLFQVQWFEDGKWVTQSHTARLKAGDIYCVEIYPAGAEAVEKDVAAALAKLPEADRKAAEAQKFCAVQDTIRLGAMGTPVKVTVGGKDVFLCCEGCRAAALKDPDKTLKTAQANKDKPLKAAAKE